MNSFLKIGKTIFSVVPGGTLDSKINNESLLIDFAIIDIAFLKLLILESIFEKKSNPILLIIILALGITDVSVVAKNYFLSLIL